MAIKLGPDFPVDYFHRGESFLRLGQFELALQDFDYAVENGDPGALCWALTALCVCRVQQCVSLPCVSI